MWSLGCVAAELFLGLPLFPGASEHDLLVRVTETLGTPPPWLLADAKHASKFFRTHVVQVRTVWRGKGCGCFIWRVHNKRVAAGGRKACRPILQRARCEGVGWPELQGGKLGRMVWESGENGVGEWGEWCGRRLGACKPRARQDVWRGAAWLSKQAEQRGKEGGMLLSP
eukprot:256554-Chlamydomonas_euryale.AAC.1